MKCVKLNENIMIYHLLIFKIINDTSSLLCQLRDHITLIVEGFPSRMVMHIRNVTELVL